MAENDRWTAQGTNTTWGPNPGDALVPPPTPQAPEIPMSTTWPWVAGLTVALRYLVIPVLVLGVAIVVIGLLVHWF